MGFNKEMTRSISTYWSLLGTKKWICRRNIHKYKIHGKDWGRTDECQQEYARMVRTLCLWARGETFVLPQGLRASAGVQRAWIQWWVSRRDVTQGSWGFSLITIFGFCSFLLSVLAQLYFEFLPQRCRTHSYKQLLGAGSAHWRWDCFCLKPS